MRKMEKVEEEIGLDFEGDMKIDPEELDIAALEQSTLAMKYSREAAYYDRKAKKAHERVKTIRAQLIKEVTEDPDGCLGSGIKATGPTIEAYYRNDKEYKEAKAQWIDAEYQRDLVKAAADHISFQRSKMVQTLTQLMQLEYFAGPPVARDLKREYAKKNDIKQQAKDAAPQRRRRS